MYYIAAPLFNKENIDTIKDIENLLDKIGKKYFSPREYGSIVGEKMTPQRMERIFDLNIIMLKKCNNMIAVIDDRDTGTIFEMGFAHAENKKIYTYTANNFGVNVMLKHSTHCHSASIKELEDMIYNGGGSRNNMRVTE